jgi:cytochrome c peroxidase
MTSPAHRLAVLFALAGACADDPRADADAEETSTGAASGDDRDDDGEPSGTTVATTPPSRDDDGSGDEATGAPVEPDEPWTWRLPNGYPEPWVPEDNPMSFAKVELGRHLFYDTRLSKDGTVSCATCHQQALAFTDGEAHAVGVTGQAHPRGSMSLVDIAYTSALGWADPGLVRLEDQVAIPMFGTHPVEMGLVDEADALARLADEPVYDELFAAAFPDDASPRTMANLAKAIAAFERSIVSRATPFDRWFFDGDQTAVSDAVKRGWELFNFPGQCTYCHFNFYFSDSTHFDALPERTIEHHNTALYDLDGNGMCPPGSEGLFAHTGDPADMGKFRSPTLRNIAVTGPYMHDGSLATLDEVLDHYGNGGRTRSPLVDPLMKRFTLTEDERADFIAFLESLTDTELLTDPALGDPWAAAE